jgi:hypothetical protein
MPAALSWHRSSLCGLCHLSVDVKRLLGKRKPFGDQPRRPAEGGFSGGCFVDSVCGWEHEKRRKRRMNR